MFVYIHSKPVHFFFSLSPSFELVLAPLHVTPIHTLTYTRVRLVFVFTMVQKIKNSEFVRDRLSFFLSFLCFSLPRARIGTSVVQLIA